MPTTQVTPAEDALLQAIAESLLKARKVVVITGAGISTNSGIPDFRSENGLYSLIQAQFDAASREHVLEPRCPASLDTNRDEREPPTKRRRLSFEDSGICLSDDSQATEEQNASGSEEAKSLRSTGSDSLTSHPIDARANGPTTRARSRESTVDGNTANKHGVTKKSDNRRMEEVTTRSTRSTRRATSLPPVKSPQKGPCTALHSSLTDTQTGSSEDERSARRILRRRGRSASPDARPRANAYRARSAVLRKRSLLTSPLDTIRAEEHNHASTLIPIEPKRTRSRTALQPGEVHKTPNPDPRPMPQAASHVTPKTTRFFFSSSPLSSPPSIFPQTPTRRSDGGAPSNLGQPELAFSSSPLSSPPPVLFDPFEEESSASGQESSVASSATSSETDETPPSSQFSKSTLPNIKGRDLFDASIWADPLRTSVFYTFATTLRQKVKDVAPTESHHFIGHLRNRGKLVRCYTQNIDQIEEKVGLSTSLQEGPGHRGRFSRKSVGAVLATTASATSSTGSETASTAPEPEEKKEADETEAIGSAEGSELAGVTSSAESQSQPRLDRKPNGVECVFLHGSLESLRCFLCGKVCDWDEDGRAYETMSGRQPECPYCAGATAARQERGKRALGVGKLRPDIVLYGEEHPSAHLISPIITHDLGLSPDLLLILGTSLRVHGLKVLVREFAKTIHSRGGRVVFVNYTKPPESSWGEIIDYWVQWDCDAWVSNLKERVPLLWLPPGTKLPKKKKEGSDKPKKRQGIAEEGPKPRPESSESGENAPKTSQPQVAVKPEKPSTVATSEAATRSPLPQTMADPDKADEPIRIEPVPRQPAKQESKATKVTASKTAPRRPMAIRDDTTNAVYVMLKVMAELRRISGGAPPSPSSPLGHRVEKPKPRRARKSAPAALPRPSDPSTPHDAANLELGAGIALVKHEFQQPRPFRDAEGIAGDVTMSETEENSILAAVKLNPRTRKRKTIDGEEVFVPGLPRRVHAAKALPRPKPMKVEKPPIKNRAVVVSPVSPKILSDIKRASMDSLTLAPLRTKEQAATMPGKPQPLEPVHSPAGPLSVLSPNSRARADPRANDPFFLTDALLFQLSQPPGRTQIQNIMFEMPKIRYQSTRETDAATALQGLRRG
ncbi:DHS-like NAD/FAD-binding domain-containing protein [Colletotrichum caudatum]|nr:DHS-like NAD/FAD-binding domain-containing protein [Colletotrichum caudatum]